MDLEAANIAIIRDYLRALQSGECGNSLRRFFTEDVLQVELPNKLNPQGGESDLAAMLARSVQGQQILREQSFEIASEIAQGQRVAIEARWTGVLATSAGPLPGGTVMKAHFAMFFWFRDGKISLQRNYDCFEAW